MFREASGVQTPLVFVTIILFIRAIVVIFSQNRVYGVFPLCRVCAQSWKSDGIGKRNVTTKRIYKSMEKVMKLIFVFQRLWKSEAKFSQILPVRTGGKLLDPLHTFLHPERKFGF